MNQRSVFWSSILFLLKYATDRVWSIIKESNFRQEEIKFREVKTLKGAKFIEITIKV